AVELEKLGGKPEWREGLVTDNGNHILDVSGLKINDAPVTEAHINGIAGVVTFGLFAHRGANILILGGDSGVTTSTA
ncbi:MAG: ribose 5-phosphate isomerase A, partial [Aestuariibacter sp.]|nr:ribose 5-phosphate isomerase A [Aestuariibacter sp.]